MSPPFAPIRIVQVSDIHLSRTRGYFNDNFAVFRDAMRAAPPDLIVYSGDVSFDGPDHPDDLAYARAEIDTIGVPWLAIPGNHDIGEAPRHAPPRPARRTPRVSAIGARSFGPQWWSRDIGRWRLVGIDTALLASDRPEEAEQDRFLDEAVGNARRPAGAARSCTCRRSMASPTIPATPRTPCRIEARGRLLDRCAAGGVRVIACGHLHVYRRLSYRDIDIVWAPATSFVNIAKRLEAGWGFPRAGYVEWTLDGDTISHRLVEPPLMITHDVGSWNAAHGSTTRMPPRR